MKSSSASRTRTSRIRLRVCVIVIVIVNAFLMRTTVQSEETTVWDREKKLFDHCWSCWKEKKKRNVKKLRVKRSQIEKETQCSSQIFSILLKSDRKLSQSRRDSDQLLFSLFKVSFSLSFPPLCKFSREVVRLRVSSSSMNYFTLSSSESLDLLSLQSNLFKRDHNHTITVDQYIAEFDVCSKFWSKSYFWSWSSLVALVQILLQACSKTRETEREVKCLVHFVDESDQL